MSLILKEKIQYYSQHWFVRNVATLQAGSFAGTAFQAIVGIFLARLLQPELFGVYSLAFGLASLAGLMLGAGTQEAVATLLGSAYARQNRDDVGDALAFLIKMTLYAGVITAVFAVFLPWIAEYFYGNALIGWYSLVVIAGVFLTTSFTALVQLSLQIVGKIKTLALITFGDQFLRFSASLFLVFLGFGVWGAVSGQLAGAVILFIISICIWKKISAEYNLFPLFGELIERVKIVPIMKYWGFSFWVAVDRNMSNMYMALPVVLTGIYVTAGEVSFFKLAFGFVNLALSLLGPISVLLNIEFPKMQIEDKAKLARNFIKVSMYGLMLSTGLTLAAVIAAPIAFRLLYGESFLPSVNYIFGLFVYGALFGIGVGLGPMWRAINKVKTSIVINLIVLGVGIPSGLWLIKSYGLWGAVIMTTAWFTVSHFASFIYLVRELKKLPKI